MQRLIGLILIVALTITASLARGFRDTMWAGYQGYVSPYLAVLPAGRPRPALSSRVVVIVIRGLRLDTSRQMEMLNALRQRGVDATMVLDVPTYRLPRWVTLTSGTAARIHGVTTNYPARLSSADTVIRQAQTNGINTAFVGSQQFDEVMGAGAGRFELIESFDVNERDNLAITATLALLNDPFNAPSLLFTELSALEESAPFGPAGYALAASATDRRLRRVLDAIDLNANTLIIVSDRGLILEQKNDTYVVRDGGSEAEVERVPLVMAGRGIRLGSQALIDAVDFAPTLAALIGAPIPVHAQGQVRSSLLDLRSAQGNNFAGDGLSPGELMWSSAAQLTAFYEHWSEVANVRRFAAETLRVHETRIKSGEEAAYQSFVMSVTAQAQAAREARLTAERAQRLPMLLGAILLSLAIVLITIGRRMWPALIGAALYLPAWHTFAYFVRGNRPSLSLFIDSNPIAFYAALERDAAISLVVLCVLVAATTAEHEDGLEAISTVMNTFGLVMMADLLGVVWFYWQWDIGFTWNLPASSELVTVLAALSHASSFSIQVSPDWPDLPLPLAAAALTLLVYGVIRRRANRVRRQWWR
ncbi:MAG: alkaline phosphatase family protein [Anaerolineae bacterium]|nr:alkaline phosphatase family protein [Thermoflexales bacterium]MDW8406944.1 alkaline phosphatase family protein [Anaerolineae bacterium]